MPVWTVVAEVPVTVIVYSPAVVPGVPLLPPLKLLLPPHALAPLVRSDRSTNIPSMLLQRRLRAGIPSIKMQARTAPPVEGQNRFNGLFSATAAVVLTVSVTVCAVMPLMVTEGGTVHVAGKFAAVGEMAQLRVIVPVKPLAGVKVIVEVLPVVAPGLTETAVPAMLKVATGAVVTARITVAELVK